LNGSLKASRGLQALLKAASRGLEGGFKGASEVLQGVLVSNAVLKCGGQAIIQVGLLRIPHSIEAGL